MMMIAQFSFGSKDWCMGRKIVSWNRIVWHVLLTQTSSRGSKIESDMQTWSAAPRLTIDNLPAAASLICSS